MKARVAESSVSSFEEGVTVNQRGLVSKILARYSTELTLFRELLQNANDAQATSLQIRFEGTGFWENTGAGADVNTASYTDNINTNRYSKTKECGSHSFSGLRICNNGNVFRREDWERIKSIADGNPDETKVGFFGVGFYSVFSLSDEPTVLSGRKALSFFWKKDALFVTHGEVPAASVDDSAEMLEVLELVKQGWTVFDLPVRPEPPYPVLPTVQDLIGFLVSALTFATRLQMVQVFFDGRPALTVGRKVMATPTRVSGPDSISNQREMFVFKDAFTEPLLYAVQRFDQPRPVHVEMMRVHSNFRVNINASFAAAMKRVTMKNPPKEVAMQLLFDVVYPNNESSSDSSALGSFSPTSSQGGYFFIGSGILQQTTGTKCHCQAPFMPTMERNAMDLSDVTLATWNKALVWTSGALHRLTFEHRCKFSPQLNLVPSISDHKGERSATPPPPGLEPILPCSLDKDVSTLAMEALFARPKPSITFQTSIDGEVNDVVYDAVDSVGGNPDMTTPLSPKSLDSPALSPAVLTKMQLRMRVHTTMATFALAPTTPVLHIGEVLGAGFFNAIKTAPTVWTTDGPKPASHARIKDETGLHELVKQCVSIVRIPEAPKMDESTAVSATNALAKQAKSALGFFASFLGVDSNDIAAADSSSSVSSRKSSSKPKKENLTELCERFVVALRDRRVLRELDVRDLAEELKARPLTGSGEAVLLLQWLVKRECTLQSMHVRHEQTPAKSQNMTAFCNWCGAVTKYNGAAVRAEHRRLKEEAATSASGMLKNFASSIFSGNDGGRPVQTVTVPVKCSSCQRVSQLDSQDIEDAAMSMLQLGR